MNYRSILAGICIGLGAFANVALGGIPGAVCFTLGLLCVVSLDLSLFTGSIGAVNLTETYKDFRDGMKPIVVLSIKALSILFKNILFFNIIGVFIASVLINFGGFDISGAALEIVRDRLSLSWTEVLCRSIGCGIIMDLIVSSYREKNSYIPILLGIPVFILCGFLHSIAEPFYIFSAMLKLTTSEILRILWLYLAMILGNFLGCRIRKIGL